MLNLDICIRMQWMRWVYGSRCPSDPLLSGKVIIGCCKRTWRLRRQNCGPRLCTKCTGRSILYSAIFLTLRNTNTRRICTDISNCIICINNIRQYYVILFGLEAMALWHSGDVCELCQLDDSCVPSYWSH